MSEQKNYLLISESFMSLCGEGQTAGVPAVFIRLSACNLTCGISQQTFSEAKKQNWSQNKIAKNQMSSASWVCDTIKVWSKGTKKQFADILNAEYIDYLKQGAHLVITGGEPLLQQDKIVEFIHYLHINQRCYPTIEIETNGTIEPKLELATLVHYWNVSPKLSNSGMPEEKRINKQVLSVLNKLNTIFKFVVSKQSDWDEICLSYLGWPNAGRPSIDKDKIWLMPAADTKEQLFENSVIVAEICKKNCVKFSNRLQVQIWDRCTGV